MLRALPSHRWTDHHRHHLMNRAGFGFPLPDSRQPHQDTPAGWVDALLDVPETLPRRDWPDWVDAPLLSMEDLRGMRDLSDAERQRQRREVFRQYRSRLRQLKAWWFNRMETSLHPLQEKVTFFWHGHFTSASTKVRNPLFLFQQNRLFREQGLGSIEDLTVAVGRDPAMLLYLDGSGSEASAPNENYARELLELFTLGEGHYSENDIREAARAFTGWRVRQALGKTSFSDRHFDPSDKIFLGQSGRFNDGDTVHIIFAQDQTARHLAWKIWSFFVYTDPGEEIIDRVADSLRQHKYHLAPVLREIFLSEAFYNRKAMRTQIKSPVMWLMSIRRLLDFHPFPGELSDQITTLLGQELFNPPSVKGWDGGRNWVSTSNLILRNNIASILINGGRPSEIGLGTRSLQSLPNDALEGMSEQQKSSLQRRFKAHNQREWSSFLRNESLEEEWKSRSGNQRLPVLVDRVYQGMLHPESANQISNTVQLPLQSNSPEALRETLTKMVSHPEFHLC